MIHIDNSNEKISETIFLFDEAFQKVYDHINLKVKETLELLHKELKDIYSYIDCNIQVNNKTYNISQQELQEKIEFISKELYSIIQEKENNYTEKLKEKNNEINAIVNLINSEVLSCKSNYDELSNRISIIERKISDGEELFEAFHLKNKDTIEKNNSLITEINILKDGLQEFIKTLSKVIVIQNEFHTKIDMLEKTISDKFKEIDSKSKKSFFQRLFNR